MRRLFGIIRAVMAVLATSVAMQAGARTAFANLPGEKWWGGFVAKGVEMPYAADTGTVYDLINENYNNQTSPLLVSSKGRYIWSEDPYRFSFTTDSVIITDNSTPMTLVSAGNTLRDAYLAASKAHFPFTGTIPEALFFSAPQYNTWIELAYNQNQRDVLAYAEAVEANGFPPGIFMIDDNWQRYYGNFDFKAERFPDAKAMCDTLHAKGYKVMVWICPFVSPDSPECRYMSGKGYLVRDKNTNGVCIVSWWNGKSAVVDMTKAEARDYLRGVLAESQKRYGIDGFKFDAGDVMYMRHAPCRYQGDSTNHDFAQQWALFGEGFAYNELRTTWKNGGRPIVHRLGDKDYSWRSLRMLVSDMTAAGLLGYPYTCPDMIGGGMLYTFVDALREGAKFDEELMVRSCQIHSMMPMMQFSVAPWRVLSKENAGICARYANKHVEMGPYILECARHASVTGEPIVRHMEYAFPGQGFEDCTSQYMLGERYMVAPMLEKGNFREVKLPKGKWRDDRGKIFKGGKIIVVDVPLDRIPVFEKL